MTIQKARNTNTITLQFTPIKINSVVVRAAPGTLGTNARGYKLSGKTITLKKVHGEITVDYDYDLAENPEGLKKYAAFSKQAFGQDLTALTIANSTKELNTAAQTAKTKRAAVEGTVIGVDVNKILGGFQSLSANISEGDKETDETVVTLLVDDVPKITVKKNLESTDQGDLLSLTGVTSTGGQLNATVVTGNPKGIEAALTEVIGAKKSLTKDALQQVSAVPAEVSVAIEEDIPNDVMVKSEKIARKTMSDLKNPFKAINPTTNLQDPFGSLGIDFGNILGAVLGNKLNVPQVSNFGDQIPSLPDGFQLPEGAVPPPPVFTINGSTNIGENLREATPLPDAVTNTEPPLRLGSSTSEFTYPLSGDYVFEEVGGKEELEAELRKVKRDITTLVVRWTKTYTNQAMDAYDLHAEHTASLIKLYGAAEFLKDRESAGIQYHYVIRRDGVIQRGRPLELKVKDETGGDKNVVNHSVQIAFVGGYNGVSGTPNARLTADSYTPSQWEAYDSFLDAWYSAYPGGQVLGQNDIVPESSGPGFDVGLYVSGKYKKTNVTETKVLSTRELNSQPSPAPVAPSRVNEQEDPALVPNTVARPDLMLGFTDGSFNDPGLGLIEVTEEVDRAIRRSNEEYNRLAIDADRIFNDTKNLQKDAKKKFTKPYPDNVKSEITAGFKEVEELEDKMYAIRKEMQNNGYGYNEVTDTWEKTDD